MNSNRWAFRNLRRLIILPFVQTVAFDSWRTIQGLIVIRAVARAWNAFNRGLNGLW
jgi:hypothetical protein